MFRILKTQKEVEEYFIQNPNGDLQGISFLDFEAAQEYLDTVAVGASFERKRIKLEIERAFLGSRCEDTIQAKYLKIALERICSEE